MATTENKYEWKETCNERCPAHADDFIKFHCPTHSFLGCQVCFYYHQKTCREVRYIPDETITGTDEYNETITSTDEYNEIKTKLENIATRSTEIIAEVKRKTESIENCHSEAVALIKAFKVELFDAIDKLEKELVEKAERFKQKETTKMTAIAVECTAVQTENKKITTYIKSLESREQKADLYVALKQSKESLLPLEDRILAVESDKRAQTLNFRPNTEILESLKSPLGFGKLFITKVEQLDDINVSSGECVKHGGHVFETRSNLM